MGCHSKNDGTLGRASRINYQERLEEWAKKDPFIYHKALISYVFNEPILDIENRLSAENMLKYFDAAQYIVENIMHAPFRTDKKE